MTIEDSIITAALTVGGGVLVYVTGRVIERAFIEPVNAQAEAITELLKTLEFYRYVYGNPDRWFNEAYQTDVQDMVREFRKAAAALAARNRTIPWHGLLYVLGLVPRRANILLATSGLYLIITLVTGWSDVVAKATREDKKALSDATQLIAKTIKNHLNVGDSPIALDLKKYIFELPIERQEELMRIMGEPQNER